MNKHTTHKNTDNIQGPVKSIQEPLKKHLKYPRTMKTTLRTTENIQEPWKPTANLQEPAKPHKDP